MKRQILTFVALATVAVGAAIAGNAVKSVNNAGPIGSTTCVTTVACHPGEAANCEFSTIKYAGDDGLGNCDQPLARDN